MAYQVKEESRRVLQCLLCGEASEMLPRHLKNKCMKHNTDEERKSELSRAKQSNQFFNQHARLWSYDSLVKIIVDPEARDALTQEMKKRGFLFQEDMTMTATTKTAPSINFSDISHLFTKLLPCMRLLQEKLESDDATDGNRDDYRRFCEAILLLKHFKPPKFVNHFKVSLTFELICIIFHNANMTRHTYY